MPRTITIKPVTTPAEKRQIAELLFEKDQPFIPLTSLGELKGSALFFFGAAMADDGRIRATASYAEWLAGCNEGEPPGIADTTIFELASSLVRDPFGGFEAPVPTVQQALTFARLMEILGADIFPRQPGEPAARRGLCIMTAIAHQNERSRVGMTGAGMIRLEKLPRWLHYEHRCWFPRIAAHGTRDPGQEADYFWFPAPAVRKFIAFMAPYVDGKPLVRKSRDEKSPREEFLLNIDIPSVRRIVQVFGSMQRAAAQLDLAQLRPPPTLAIIGDSTF
jgi:hypothetical protein